MTKRSAILLVAGMCILGVSVLAAKHHVWRRDTVLKVAPCAHLSGRALPQAPDLRAEGKKPQ